MQLVPLLLDEGHDRAESVVPEPLGGPRGDGHSVGGIAERRDEAHCEPSEEHENEGSDAGHDPTAQIGTPRRSTARALRRRHDVVGWRRPPRMPDGATREPPMSLLLL